MDGLHNNNGRISFTVKGEAREDKGGKKGHAGGGDKKQKRQKR